MSFTWNWKVLTLQRFTDWGWGCPLSQVGTPNGIISLQHEALCTTESTAAVVLKRCCGRVAIHASMGRGLQSFTRNGFTSWQWFSPLARASAMECIGASHLISRMALKLTAGAVGKGSKRVHTVHGSMDRGFQALALHSFTLRGVTCPASRSQTLQLARSIQFIAFSTVKTTL